MTAPTPITTGTGASEHADRYEALRRHVIEPHDVPAAREGLAVLLRQGVVAWMKAWSRLPAPGVRTVQNECEKPPLPDGASAEVVRVIAAMALGHIEEVHA
jgi:hypothetical protein